MKRTSYMLVSLAIMLAAAANAALPRPQGAEFAKGAVLTVDGYAGQSTLENFPVLVSIAERDETAGTGIGGFFYRDVKNAAATDLADIDIGFIDMQGNGLAYEIDTWNPSGESLVWVRLPEMTNGTQFVFCYGGDSLKDYKNARYEIANYGRAAVNVDFRAQSVTLADDTAFLDLEGHVLTLRDFCWVTDSGVVTNTLKAGTYSAAALAGLGAPVEDSSSGGGGSVVTA